MFSYSLFFSTSAGDIFLILRTGTALFKHCLAHCISRPAVIKLYKVNILSVPEHTQNGPVLSFKVKREHFLNGRSPFAQGVKLVIRKRERNCELSVLDLVYALFSAVLLIGT